MKSHRFLIGLVGFAAIGTFAVYATGQQPSVPRVNLYQPPASMAPTCAPACMAPQGYYSSNQPPSELRKTLDANPTLVPFLMEMMAKGDESERRAAERTLNAVCQIAVPELIKALHDPDLANRRAAIELLTNAAVSARNYPFSDVISALMKIAQDENEPDELRKISKVTICQILQISQGDFSSLQSESASPGQGS